MATDNPTRTPSGFLTFVGGILCLAIFSALIIWWVKSQGRVQDLQARRSADRVKRLSELTKADQEALTTTGWANKEKQIARIPITEAKQLVVAQYAKSTAVATQVKVEPPLPPVTRDPNSTEPPPAALPSAPQGADTLNFRSAISADAAASNPNISK